MFDCIIIGGGIVGLATAFQLQRSSLLLKILLLEKEPQPAKHQTGNNSGVIHSGIYYKPGSLKASNCIRGYHQLIAFCKEQGIPFELCGKIIVATNESEKAQLSTLYDRGLQNGLTDLKRLKKEELRDYEPHVNGLEGIFVPQTGIVDYKLVAGKYGELILRNGAEIHLSETVIAIKESEVIT